MSLLEITLYHDASVAPIRETISEIITRKSF